jgi:hypothetical protein
LLVLIFSMCQMFPSPASLKDSLWMFLRKILQNQFCPSHLSLKIAPIRLFSQTLSYLTWLEITRDIIRNECGKGKM